MLRPQSMISMAARYTRQDNANALHRQLLELRYAAQMARLSRHGTDPFARDRARWRISLVCRCKHKLHSPADSTLRHRLHTRLWAQGVAQ